MNRLEKDKWFYIGLFLVCFGLIVLSWVVQDLKGMPTLAEEMNLFFPES